MKFRSLSRTPPFAPFACVPTLNPLRRIHTASPDGQRGQKNPRIYVGRQSIEEVLSRPENVCLTTSGWRLLRLEDKQQDAWALRKTFDQQFETWNQAICWLHHGLRPIAEKFNVSLTNVKADRLCYNELVFEADRTSSSM